MKKPPNDQSPSQSPTPTRPVLRLVPTPAAPAAAPTPAQAAAPDDGRPRRQSSLVNFMTAYADAIDRDIRLLLEI